MKDYKQVRMDLGFSQRDFSRYLGISRSHFSMCELGLRSLKPETIFRIADLDSAFKKSKNTRPGVSRQEVLINTNDSSVKMKLATLEHRLATKARQLETMQIKYEQNNRLLDSLDFLEEHEGDHAWIQIKKYSVKTSLLVTGIPSQNQLEDDMKRISVEIDSIRGPDGMESKSL